MRLRSLALFALFAAAACSDHHPLAGAWNQELPGGAHGMHVAFDTKGDKVNIGLPPRPDDTHDHVHGTYTFDAVSKAVVVKAKLGGDGKADTWSGTLAGERLELSGGEQKVAFVRGDKAHGH
jgi:hypothetical protein